MPPMRDGKSRAEILIDVADAPVDMQEGILFLRSLKTKTDWEHVTGSMSGVHKDFFRLARDMSQTERNKAARDGIERFEAFERDNGNADPMMKGVLAPFYLSDEQLDLAISTFQPDKMN